MKTGLKVYLVTYGDGQDVMHVVAHSMGDIEEQWTDGVIEEIKLIDDEVIIIEKK